MKTCLWQVQRTDPIGHDEYKAFVIRADSPEGARHLAEITAGDFAPKGIWYAETTKVIQLIEDGPQQVIMRSFKAG